MKIKGKNILIRGKATIETRRRLDNKLTRVDTFIIDTIVDKNTHEIVTFFPEAYTPKKEIQQKLKKLHTEFEQCFFTREDENRDAGQLPKTKIKLCRCLNTPNIFSLALLRPV